MKRSVLNLIDFLRVRYVSLMQSCRRFAGRTGLLNWLDVKAEHHHVLLWLRSLLSIYDIDDMVAISRPWWTFEAQDCVAKFLAYRKNARILEYGSGASTLWLAHRASEVHSIEHDQSAAAVLGPFVAELPNVCMHVVIPRTSETGVKSRRRGWQGYDFTEYVSMASTIGGHFDLVVIDGRCRVACLRAALPHLADDGLILFDDGRRSRYREGLHAIALQRFQTFGLATSLPYPSATTLMARHKNVLAKLRD